MKFRSLVLASLLLSGAAQAQDTPDVTEDGLVRVPSSKKVGVYRAPGIPFAQYRRVIINPSIPVTFRRGWQREHPELKEDDREKIRADFVRLFLTELEKELVERGGFAAAESPMPDVIRVDASISALNITAPDAGTTPAERTYTRNAGSMTLTVELRDAASGVLIGRIIDFERTREYQEAQLVNQVTNEAEFRVGLAAAARYTREAINVAKTDRR